MLDPFLTWLQYSLGKGSGDIAQSWSEALLGTLNFWGLLEATHLLALMLFAGTILVVDLRLMGVSFRRTPVSVVSDRVLPLTLIGFIVVAITGVALFYAKPLLYYHNVWFRVKMLLLLLALCNIVFFHNRIQATRSTWDTDARPPRSAVTAGAVSLLLWLLVLMFGRFIAYDWFECGKPQPSFINWVQECSTSENGARDLTGQRR